MTNQSIGEVLREVFTTLGQQIRDAAKEVYYFITDLFKPVLSDRTIMRLNKKGILIEGELKPEQIQPNSVDLTLGDTFKRLKPNGDLFAGPVIDVRDPINYEAGTFCEDPISNADAMAPGVKWYKLEPGEFCLMASKEVLNIPNGVLSFVQGRSSIARIAIQTEQAGLIDAGFRGTITFEVYNQSKYPIVLFSGMRIAQVYFFKAQHASKVYGDPSRGSKYYNQMEATGSRIYIDPEIHY